MHNINPNNINPITAHNTTNYHHRLRHYNLPPPLATPQTTTTNYHHKLPPQTTTTNYHHNALAELAPTSVGKVLSGWYVFLGFPTPPTTTTMHLLNSPRRQ
jgi:hypothetical protein